MLDSWASRLYPDDRERVLEAFGAHINDRSGRTGFDITYRLVLKNNEVRWFRARGQTRRTPMARRCGWWARWPMSMPCTSRNPCAATRKTSTAPWKRTCRR